VSPARATTKVSDCAKECDSVHAVLVESGVTEPAVEQAVESD
jgi:hypothetical protein